jgi:hypothetical protein
MQSEPLVKLEYAIAADAETPEPVLKIKGPVILALGARLGTVLLSDALLLPLLRSQKPEARRSKK